MNETAGDRSCARRSAPLRPAAPRDLPALLRLTLAGLGHSDLADAVGPEDVHPFHLHALQHGRVIVAENGDLVVGYASAIERASVRILSQVFVRADLQSAGIGRRLVEAIDPIDDRQRLLVASVDKRAQALYIRRGYVPGWPVYTVTCSPWMLEKLPSAAMTIAPAAVNDDLVRLDAMVSGRQRRDDLAFLATSSGGRPHVLLRAGTTVGCAWINDPLLGAMSGWFDGDAPLHVGPIGVLSPEDARDGVLTTLRHVREEFPTRGVSIEIAGPHAALAVLLSAGGRIVEAETYMSSAYAGGGSADCYVPSGGVLY